MRISLTHIETFYWAARLKSFHATSRRLHLTQPSVSARIRELENVLGYHLFERDARGAALTARGAALLHKATRLLDLADGIVNDDPTPMHGLLRLGANESVALSGLPAFIASLSARYPTLQIEMSIDVGYVLRGRLRAGGLDFALTADPSGHPHIQDVLLGESEMCWVGAMTGATPACKRLSAADIAQLPVMTIPAPSALHGLTTRWFDDARVPPARMSLCNSFAVMLRLVAAGMAVAILPRAILQRELEDGRLTVLNVDQPVPALPIYASFPLIGDVRVSEAIAGMARAALAASGLLV